jgi:adenylate kinase
MDRGELVPDSVTNEMVKDRLTHDDTKSGFLLDGFPRNVAQAQVLRDILAEKKTPLHAVLEFALGDEEIVARLSSRRTCRDCGAPSVGQEKCPTCGGQVYQREDDKAEVIKRRLEVYSEQTAPIIAFYRNEGLLISVSAVGSVEAITDSAISALKNVAQ